MVIHASIDSLDWETSFFGLHSGILRFSETADALSVEHLSAWQRVQAKINASDTTVLMALQALGFQVVEGEIDFTLEVTPEISALVSIPVAVVEHIPALRELAKTMFTHSRFSPPWYQHGDSGRFYGQWIENAVRGTFDHQCLYIPGKKHDIAGFVTLRQLSSTDARIGLLGGRGYGEPLMQAARHWCQQRGLSRLHVATQFGNLPALRRYMQSGGRVESTTYWLYR